MISLKEQIRDPEEKYLNLMEINRLHFNPSTRRAVSVETKEKIMLLGMFIFGKILTVKILMKPSESGMGIIPSNL